MAKKKKNQLPSGSIRIQVYDYTDVDGKNTTSHSRLPHARRPSIWPLNGKPGKQTRNLSA